MGIATERKLAAVSGPDVHSLSTVRALPTMAREVSDSQILDAKTAVPLRLVKPAAPLPGPTLSDLATLKFFEEGQRQETEGVYRETEHIPLRSLDRVPLRLGPALLTMSVALGGAAAAGWWLGLRAFSLL
jgi:hypothetical protein